MIQEHPITPPLELIRKWNEEATNASMADQRYIATQAARWGADQELEACCEWLHEWTLDKHPGGIANLRSARRPKILSKKERALDSLLKCYAYIDDDLYNDIKEVIESLPDEQ